MSDSEGKGVAIYEVILAGTTGDRAEHDTVPGVLCAARRLCLDLGTHYGASSMHRKGLIVTVDYGDGPVYNGTLTRQARGHA